VKIDHLEEGASVWPRVMQQVSVRNAPDEVNGALNEAAACLTVDAFSASGCMSRRAMQVAARSALTANGIEPQDSLHKEIQALKKHGILQGVVFELADTARLVGNSAAHSDVFVLTKHDAELTLRFAVLVAQELFEIPADLEEIKKKLRATRKDQAPPTQSKTRPMPQGNA
jgi:hypothetical protein